MLRRFPPRSPRLRQIPPRSPIARLLMRRATFWCASSRVVELGRDHPAVAVVLAAGAGTRFAGRRPQARRPHRRPSAPRPRRRRRRRGGDRPGRRGDRRRRSRPRCPPSVVHVVNDRWAEGQMTSLRAGHRRRRELGASAVVVGLGDQPFVTPTRGAPSPPTDAPIAVATYDGRRGHPVRLAARDVGPARRRRRRRRPHADAPSTRSRR